MSWVSLLLPRTEGGETTVFVQQFDVGEADAAEQVELVYCLYEPDPMAKFCRTRPA